MRKQITRFPHNSNISCFRHSDGISEAQNKQQSTENEELNDTEKCIGYLSIQSFSPCYLKLS